jgi:hypothetical protein
MFLTHCLVAQTIGEDYTVKISATTIDNPPQITLSWLGNSGANSYRIYRKVWPNLAWGTPIANLSGVIRQYTDRTAAIGKVYEYKVEAIRPNFDPGVATGFVLAGIQAPATTAMGSMVLVVDSLAMTSLPGKIAQLQTDLTGDGWKVHQLVVSRSARPEFVRAELQRLHVLDQEIIAAYLVGHVPVPYSGNLAPDGHPDHKGAWPTDAYYADLDGEWTDQYVMNDTASRVANKNLPGDGKFDQTVFPSNIELEVGRVDFWGMPAFAKNEMALLASYLDKAHEFKMGRIKPVASGVIDDNFPTYAEGFAQNGWRNFSPLLGKDKVVSGDYFQTLDTAAYLWSYGCGAGGYTSCSGVGNTASYASRLPKGIFTMTFGSYFGDWDSPDNFLRAGLASGNILTNVWAGRPNYFFHHMGLGLNIGFSYWISIANPFLGYPYEWEGLASGGIHSQLLGDPSLRMSYPEGPATFAAAGGTEETALNWTPSPDPAVLGYYLFRATEPSGTFTQVNADILTGTAYTDKCLAAGDYTYMIRALRLDTTGSGSYYNLSVGIFDTARVAARQDSILVEIQKTPVSCHGASDGQLLVSVANAALPLSYRWSNGLTTPDLHQLAAGNYQLTLTDFCGRTKIVVVNLEQPSKLDAKPTVRDESYADGNDGSIKLLPEGGTPPYRVAWSNGASGMQLGGLAPGMYSYTLTDANDCKDFGTLTVQRYVCRLSIQLQQDGPKCTGDTARVNFQISGGVAPYRFLTNGPGSYLPGTYTTVFGDEKGCHDSLNFTIRAVPPIVVTLDSVVHPSTATRGSIYVSVAGGTPPFQYTWEWRGASGQKQFPMQDIVGLLDPGMLTLRVTDANGCVQWFSAEILLLSGTFHPVLDDFVKVFPNPVGNQLTVEMNLPAVRKISLKIFDSQGSLIFEKSPTASASHTETIDFQGVPAGEYLLRVEAGDATLTKKLVKI